MILADADFLIFLKCWEWFDEDRKITDLMELAETVICWAFAGFISTGACSLSLGQQRKNLRQQFHLHELHRALFSSFSGDGLVCHLIIIKSWVEIKDRDQWCMPTDPSMVNLSLPTNNYLCLPFMEIGIEFLLPGLSLFIQIRKQLWEECKFCNPVGSTNFKTFYFEWYVWLACYILRLSDMQIVILDD